MTGKLKHGFTIVELLIVIVVIAILASISVVAYNGIQSRANDSRIRNAASQVAKAISAYSVTASSNAVVGGFGSTVAPSAQGCVDGSQGWFASGVYTCTAEDHLVRNGALPSGFTRALPRNTHHGSNTDGGLSLMLYDCGANRKALYYTLQNPTAEDSASINNALTTCSNTVNIRDVWGMRAAMLVPLSS